MEIPRKLRIGLRLKEEREKLGLNQTECARLAGASKNSLWNWEKGAATPNAEALAHLEEAGADVLYILTGRREKPVTELGDRERLAAAIRTVEKGLALAKKGFSPEQRAELILAAYDIFAAAEPQQAEEDKVIRLIRAA